MRIISGKYKGRVLAGFDIDGTRPTMDRVKESLFAIIQKYVKDSIVLDLFAGSGSLGIEALSNGSKKCFFVDKNQELIYILKKNTKLLEEDFEIIKADYSNALFNFKKDNIKFDIIFLDPPYKLNLINDALNKIYKYDLLNENGIVVCEYEMEDIDCKFYMPISNKRYGSKHITIFKNIK